MTNETAQALNELSRRLFETEQKLDNYFKMLHDQNVEKINLVAAAADEQMAAKAVGLYPKHSDHIGLELTQQMISEGRNRFVGEDGFLYKTTTPHTLSEEWKPSQATASIWTIINVEHAGTYEDPIPAAAGMEYTLNLYYIEDGVIYKMNRCDETDGNQVLQYMPSQLVGHYFEVVE